MTESSKLSKWFKLIAIFAILWNIMGFISFYFHTYMPAEEISKLPEQEQLLYQNIPIWKTISFFIATFGGLLGSVLLFFKKKIALPVFVISLIGIVASFYYDFFKTNLLEVYGNESVIFPSIVVVIGVLLVWLASKIE